MLVFLNFSDPSTPGDANKCKIFKFPGIRFFILSELVIEANAFN